MFLQRFCISYKRKWKWWGGCYGVCINKELWNYNISYITWTWQCNVDGKKEKNKYKHLAMWIASICSKLPKGWHLPTCKRKGQPNDYQIRNIILKNTDLKRKEFLIISPARILVSDAVCQWSEEQCCQSCNRTWGFHSINKRHDISNTNG